MISNTPHLAEVPPEPGSEFPDERTARVWVSRLTGVVGGVMLLLALFEWFARHGHYRLVLALFTVAMFCAILHSYVFEDSQD
jgi:uncharacterized membrane protein